MASMAFHLEAVCCSSISPSTPLSYLLLLLCILLYSQIMIWSPAVDLNLTAKAHLERWVSLYDQLTYRVVVASL
jgi:hypothetical protein